MEMDNIFSVKLSRLVSIFKTSFFVVRALTSFYKLNYTKRRLGWNSIAIQVK